LDVGADVDPGLGDPENDFWEQLREQVQTTRSDAVLIGEEWGDATPWLLGKEWDAVMNYRLRSALLSWLFSGCQGEGCQGGQLFEDGDSNGGSPLGAIYRLPPSALDVRLRGIAEDYPPPALRSMMNLLGSHDTARINFLLNKINRDDPRAAHRALKLLWTFLYSYIGVPTLYYGDELNLRADSVYAHDRWHDDPFNRAPFPWPDTPGEYSGEPELMRTLQQLSSLRLGHRVLQDGEIIHGILLDDERGLYGFARHQGERLALILFNRGEEEAQVQLDLRGRGLPEEAGFFDGLSGASYSLQAGLLECSIPEEGALLLLRPEESERPKAPVLLSVDEELDVLRLRWAPVLEDEGGGREAILAYEILQGEEVLSRIEPPLFGGTLEARLPLDGGPYRVRALSAAAVSALSSALPLERVLDPDARLETPRPQDAGRLQPEPSIPPELEERSSSPGGCQQGGSTPWGFLSLLLFGLIRTTD